MCVMSSDKAFLILILNVHVVGKFERAKSLQGRIQPHTFCCSICSECSEVRCFASLRVSAA